MRFSYKNDAVWTKMCRKNKNTQVKCAEQLVFKVQTKNELSLSVVKHQQEEEVQTKERQQKAQQTPQHAANPI